MKAVLNDPSTDEWIKKMWDTGCETDHKDVFIVQHGKYGQKF